MKTTDLYILLGDSGYMKHSLKITLILVLLFLVTQLFGLATVTKYISVGEKDGDTFIDHSATMLGEPPEIENKSTTFIWITLAVVVGTLLMLLFVKYNLSRAWKVWFFLAIWMTIGTSLSVYLNDYSAAAIAFLLALYRIFRQNVFVHNITEVFVYTGIVVVFLPIINLMSAFVLLLIISLYDMYAVWKSKHMVKMAKFQTQSKMFAGLFVPYKIGRKPKKGEKTKKVKVKHAILGGGDMAFPLIFTATVIEYLILSFGFSKLTAFLYSLIVVGCCTATLLGLFMKAKKDKFYPAMPFISAGCYVGFGIVYLLTFI